MTAILGIWAKTRFLFRFGTLDLEPPWLQEVHPTRRGKRTSPRVSRAASALRPQLINNWLPDDANGRNKHKHGSEESHGYVDRIRLPYMQGDAVKGNSEKVVEQEERIVDRAAHEPGWLSEILLPFLDILDEASLHDG